MRKCLPCCYRYVVAAARLVAAAVSAAGQFTQDLSKNRFARGTFSVS
jgi:hypothetical protein